MKPKQTAFLLLAIMAVAGTTYAQEEDLISQIEERPPTTTPVTGAFKSSRIIMAHSIEMLRPGVLDFRILHRFGRINGGAYEFFGLDGPATVRLGLDYGLSKNFTVGIGRSTFNKELDGFLKLRMLQQATGARKVPFSLVAVAGTTVSTMKWTNPSRENYFSSRMAYYAQLLVGRKFNEKLTLQLMPGIVHRNLVPTKADPNDIYTAGIGGRMKLSKRISVNLDYHYVMNHNSAAGFHNPLSLGLDIETGGHVFQLHFTNARGMNERAFLAATEYEWDQGDIFFGFNISRTFQLRKK